MPNRSTRHSHVHGAPNAAEFVEYLAHNLAAISPHGLLLGHRSRQMTHYYDGIGAAVSFRRVPNIRSGGTYGLSSGVCD